MKFKEKDIDKNKKRSSKGASKGASRKSTPFKIKVVDVEEEKSIKSPKKDKKATKSEKNTPKSEKKSKPNINLLVSHEDELEKFETDFDNEVSDIDDDGDFDNFAEEIAKIDGKKKKILSNRDEVSEEVSQYNLSGKHVWSRLKKCLKTYLDQASIFRLHY